MASKGKSGTSRGAHRGKRSTRARGSRAQKKAAGQSLISKAVSAILKPARAARPAPKPKVKPSRDTGPNWIQRIGASLSPAYRRRLERAAEQGKTRQQARGHKPKEHVERKKREESQAKATGKLTTPQRKRLREFVKQQAVKNGADPDDTWDDRREEFEAKGYAWFLRILERQQEFERVGDTRTERRVGTGSVGTRADLDAVASYLDLGLEEDDGWMLFYH